MLKERGVREVLSMRAGKPDAAAGAASSQPVRIAPAPTAAPVPVESNEALLFDDDFDDIPITQPRAAAPQAPKVSDAIAPPPVMQRMIAPWTVEQYRKLGAIAENSPSAAEF